MTESGERGGGPPTGSDPGTTTLECTITETDFVRAMWTHLRPRPALRVLGIALVVVLLAVLAYSARRLGSSGDDGKFWVLLFAVVYFLFMFGVWYPHRAKRIYRQYKNTDRPFTVELSDEGLGLASSIGHVLRPWDHFRKWKEGRSVLLIYLTDAMYQILPKRCLTAEQLETVRGILERRIRRVA